MDRDFEEIEHKVCTAIGILFERDSFLLENGVHERSVSHKLAEYLQILFPDWHVDCEYNRYESDPKKIKDKSNGGRKPTRVFPDIIIHRRGEIDNLLIIEMKTKSAEIKHDREKIISLIKEKKYNYCFGLFIKFQEIKPVYLEWYRRIKKCGPNDESECEILKKYHIKPKTDQLQKHKS